MQMFKRAERKGVKIKLGLTGPSGSGKTYSALKLAAGLGKKIAVLDTENDSAQLYAGMEGIPEFDSVTMNPPFHSDKYKKAIDSAVAGGYDVLIIDSVSHQWNGEGGIMDRMDKEKLANPRANSYTMWSKYTPEHERFKQSIVQSPIHIIATMRSKSEYVMQGNEKGKMTPQKVGMAAVQRDQFEYEFTTIFDISMEHYASVSKDRTGLFDGETFKIEEIHGQKVIQWLNAAKIAYEPPKPKEEPKSENKPQQQEQINQAKGPKPRPPFQSNKPHNYAPNAPLNSSQQMEIFNHIKSGEPNPTHQKEMLKAIFKVDSYRALVTEHYAQFRKTLDMGMSLFDEYMNILELENALDCVEESNSKHIEEVIDESLESAIEESNSHASMSAEEVEALNYQES
jgi:hypothetical protein